MDWVGRRVLVLGAARQGLALAKFLSDRGARVTVNDVAPAEKFVALRKALGNRPIDWVFGEHPLRLLGQAELVCVSGGVPLDLPIIVEARRRGLSLSNDSQIFLAEAPCKVIGITGSAGKTTTTALLGQMGAWSAKLEKPRTAHSHQEEWWPAKTWVGGNIGNPLISEVDRMRSDDLAVMELSSFQLELMDRSPQIAAILNLTPNHLDRHGTMDAYTAAKARILDFQRPEDSAVLGRDDLGSWALLNRVRGKLSSFGFSTLPMRGLGTLVRDGQVYAVRPEGELQLFAVKEILLRGAHNVLNVLAACALGIAANLPIEAIRRAAVAFTGLPHRLEYVREWGGAAWYNDSIATAPERTMAAIRSFVEPLILLAGGRDKDLSWTDLAALMRDRVEHLIVFGEAAALIIEAIKKNGGRGRLESLIACANLQSAVHQAAALAEPGYVVLMSPGGTSFDEFDDFEQRGEYFKKWVMELT